MADTRTFKPGKRKPYSVAVTYVIPTRAMRQADHRERMRPEKDWRPHVRPDSIARVGIPASINCRTGKPHEHRREIDRRLAKIGGAS